ncbi:glycosyltransferase family 2 protein [Phycicoccus avicenniae]|uniref:glycosyltransferase family 2 protein n=1 Tax=Phycicoccus avicenniae TaxID=2828860 RepID=UPI003D2D8BCE
MALAAAAMLWFALALTDPESRTPPDEGLLFGAWQVLYDTQAPSTQLLVAAVALALLLAAAVAAIESRISKRYRRSENAGETPLAPKLVMARTAGVFHGPVTVTVLIPAHNEEDRIAATLASLEEQTSRPDRVVVVADNCTDATEDLARAAGVEVFATVGNTHKKAGGLNQALASLLPGMGENDTVMVMDADTVIGREYIETAKARMTGDRALMAIGGLFMGEDGNGLIGQFQRNEYIRYSRDIKRRRGRLFVLTGTASVFRSGALREVAAQRGRLIPGIAGDVYDTVSLTEDNELTLALKSLGALMTSPAQCTVVTEVMPTWGAIWHQRLRWQRGALENLGAYGITPQTSRYWVQQFGIGYGAVALLAYYVAIFTMAMSLDEWVWFPFWLGIGVVFMVERVISAWRGGWRARLVALTLFPELVYATFLNVVFLRGVFDILTGKQAQWSHVTRTADGKVVVREGESA